MNEEADEGAHQLRIGTLKAYLTILSDLLKLLQVSLDSPELCFRCEDAKHCNHESVRGPARKGCNSNHGGE
jgi:hypothetical protein